MKHVPDEWLVRAVQRSLPPMAACQTVEHAAQCRECFDRLRRVPKADRWLLGLLADWWPTIPDAVRRAALEFLPEICAHTLPPVAERRCYVQVLLDLAKEHFLVDPKEAEVYARQALGVLGTLPPAGRRVGYSTAEVQGDVVLGLAFLGNSLRAQGRFRPAMRVLNRRVPQVDGKDSSSGVALAWLARTRAALARDLRQFEEAETLANQSIEGFRLAGREIEALEDVVGLGTTQVEAGRFQAATATFRSVLASAPDDAGYFRVIFGARFNLAYCQALEGWALAARRHLQPLEELMRMVPLPYARRRLRWLQVLIHQGAGQDGRALAGFTRLRDEFLAEDLPYEAAQLALELAVLCLQGGRTRQAARLAVLLPPIFEAHGVEREAWMAFRVTVEALRREEASVHQLQAVWEALHATRLQLAGAP